MTINKSDIVICQHFHEDGSSKVRPILVVKKLNDYEFYGYPITSKDHRNDFRARCMILLDWQTEGLYKTSFVTIKFNDKWQKRKYNLSQVAGDGPIGRLSDTDMRRLNTLIQNTTQEDKARLTESLDLNAIYKDDQRTFGFLSEITYADAVYVLKSGKILDTKGPFENQQHENIALYNKDRYGIDDLDENNGSKLMNQANAIRVTPWLKSLYLPKRPVSEEQCQSLTNWISKLKLSKDNPLMISTLDGSDYFEVNRKLPATQIVDIIKDYYVSGHLSENLREALTEAEESLNINDSVVIINTNDVFEGLHGDILSIVDDTVTVEIVDFPSNNGEKRITQMFDIDNVMKE